MEKEKEKERCDDEQKKKRKLGMIEVSFYTKIEEEKLMESGLELTYPASS